MGDSNIKTNKQCSNILNTPTQVQFWSPPKKIDLLMTHTKSEKRMDQINKSTKGWKRFIGMILTFISSLLFSIGTLIVKILQDYNFHGNSSSFWRYIGVTVPAIPLLLFFNIYSIKKTNKTIFHSIWPLNEDGKWKTVIGLLGRGMLGGLSVLFRYYALQYLPIADTAVITYSSPILVTILAHFLLGETLGIIPILLTFTTLGGVILIARPPIITGDDNYEPEMLVGIGLACGSLICASFIVIITRKIRDVHFSLMTLTFGLIGVIQSFALTIYFDDFIIPSELYDTLLTIGLAIFSFIGQMTIIMAVQVEQAGPVSLIRTCDVVFGFLLQFLFLGVIPSLYSTLGGTIVLFGVILTGVRKYIATMEEDDPTRKRLRYILK